MNILWFSVLQEIYLFIEQKVLLVLLVLLDLLVLLVQLDLLVLPVAVLSFPSPRDRQSP